ncbi:MAG: recG [Candidatus Saccharibacteria bacterium]|nr:recG [Candidatus Saccharibacteria bacterium]
MMLSTVLTELKGVGPAAAAKFGVLGLKTVGDLVTYWPRRYDDYSQVVTMKDLKPGAVTLSGTIDTITSRYVRRGMHITEAQAHDATGVVRLVWFNQPYRANSIKPGQQYFISGNYELSHQRFGLLNPTIELAQEFTVNTARIVPIYKETKGLTSRQIRAAVADALPKLTLDETLPQWLIDEADLLDYSTAVHTMHFPESAEALAVAKRRLGFEEVFGLSLASQYAKQELQLERALPVQFKPELAKLFVSQLPFTLTDGQRATAWQIFTDMERPTPMNRLVEGDVGSGKTVVATMAAVMAMDQGYQVAFMAPTELLARQHANTLALLLSDKKHQDRVGLLVGSMKTAQKTAAREAIKDGRIQCIVGTQALIQDSVDMHKLALVIIDEQHRFGVDQRKALMLKSGHMPHVLSMTATPIPRSLALTLYGEMDISVLREKPAGRQEVQTELVSPNSQAQLFDKVQAELQAGRQAFVVCPLIAESAVLDAQSAEATYERLRQHELKKWRVGLLHGKLKPADKQAVMEQFVRHELDVLVSTTVIEVGVDIPNASVMLIETPERFGLAQLHQLRGRIGRGAHQSYCYALLSDSKAPGRRLRAFESTYDGFKLSELDLQLRGPGAIYGTLQHGALDLRIAQLSDTVLIAEAQKAAKAFIKREENLLHYTTLAQTITRLQTVTNLN